MTATPQNTDGGNPPLPPKEFYGYAIGNVGPITMLDLINILLVNYYIFVIGLEPLVSGFALTIGLGLLSFLSLYFGNYSDNLAGRWVQKHGRRRPFLVWGMFGMVFSFILMWFPPTKPGFAGMLEWGTTLWFWTFSAIFHVSYAAFSTAYWTLLPEITHRDEERMRVSIAQNLFGLIATIISIAVPIIFLSGSTWNQSLWYSDPSGAGSRIITQMVFYSILFSLITVVTISLSFLFVKEPPFQYNKQEKKKFKVFMREMVEPFQRKDFSWYMVSTFTINITMRIIYTDILLFVRIVLKLDGLQWFVFGGILAASGVLSFLGWDKLTKKLGLKKAFLLVLSIATVCMCSAVIFLIDLPPEIRFPTGLIVISIGAATLVGMMIFMNPILAALIDKHKKSVHPEEGDKLAGKYNGINGFVVNISQALANVLYGSIMAILGSENPVAIVIMLPVAGFFIALGYVTFKKVNIT